MGTRKVDDEYSHKDFQKWISGRTFFNPRTNRKVKFDSLPEEEKRRVRGEWADVSNEEAEKKTERAKLPKPTSQQLKDLKSWRGDPKKEAPASLAGTPYTKVYRVQGESRPRHTLTDAGEELLHSLKAASSPSAPRVASRWLHKIATR